MTKLHFTKWQGTGNDFIILDNRDLKNNGLSSDMINNLCDRRFGIGADGLMILNDNPIYDFAMQYFNADGLEAEMCGNGARCMIAYAYQLGIIGLETRFLARDGYHKGRVLGENNYEIHMIDLKEFRKINDYYFLNTGVPHVVKFVKDLDKVDVYQEGSYIRNLEDFSPEGSNVNFVEVQNELIKLRTYERGVENETLSCGTGAVASAIAACLKFDLKQESYICRVPGGQLKVSFKRTDTGEFSNILLEGPAHYVFEGSLEL